MHLGHGRGAALGTALSNLLSEAGYAVEREFYINDAGRQVKLLGMSVFAKYKDLCGLQYPFLKTGTRGTISRTSLKSAADAGCRLQDAGRRTA